MKYSFYDDYSEGAHPELLKYISDNNTDQQLGYCEDTYCELGAERIKNAFGVPDADVHFLPNGTISNVVGLKSMLQSYEGAISTDEGHINTHEAGALEAAGQKVIWVESPDGKLTPDLIDVALSRYMPTHTVKPRVIYLSQVTELGTVYSLEELRAVIEHAKSKSLYVYIDGARLAMALASKAFGATMKDLGSLGVDMMYVGGTKVGGIYGEATIILNDDLKTEFRSHMKQRGALMAKGRFMGQQFARFFDEDNLWLSLAEHANNMTLKLYEGLTELGTEFDLAPDANQAFPTMPNAAIEKLSENYGFHVWNKVGDDKTKIRLVCSWATPEAMIDEFLSDAKEALAL